MALKITTGLSLNKILTTLGFSFADIKLAEKAGVAMKIEANVLEVHFPHETPVLIESTADTLMALKQNNLQPAHKKKLYERVRKALEDAIPAMKAHYVVVDNEPKVNVGTLDILKKAMAEKPEPEMTFQSAATIEMFDLNEMKTAPCVQLRDATKMYQPVNGTSPGSRYFCVAISDELRVAVRYAGGKLSVRVEGPEFKKHLLAIKEAGFDPHSDQEYASIHVMCPNIYSARQALGALLLGVGVEWKSPTPKLEVIQKA